MKAIIKNTLMGGAAVAVIAGAGYGMSTLDQTPEPIVQEIENVSTPTTTTVAVIENDVVVNMVLVPLGWTGTGANEWRPPVGTEAVKTDVGAIGDRYENGVFIRIQ